MSSANIGSPDLKDRLFVPLSTHYLDDEIVSSVSVLAQQLYIRSLLIAKRSASNGSFLLRAVSGSLYGALLAPGVSVNDELVTSAAEELGTVTDSTGRPLWTLIDGSTGRFLITGYEKHNGKALALAERNRAQALALGERKAAGAHITNHGKGLHDDEPRDGCPICYPNPQVGALGSASGRTAESVSAPDSGAIPHLTSPHLNSIETPPSPRARVSKQERFNLISLVGDTAEALGMDPAAAVTLGITETVQTAQTAGWAPEQIVSVAQLARAKRWPSKWLAAVLANPENLDRPHLRTADDFARFFAEHDEHQDDDRQEATA